MKLKGLYGENFEVVVVLSGQFDIPTISIFFKHPTILNEFLEYEYN